MNKRPLSITFIAWFLIVTGTFSALVMLISRNNPVFLEELAKNPIPVPIQLAIAFLGLAISIFSSIFMLRGANWSRFLYVGWCVISILITLVTSPAKATAIPGIIIFGIIVFFLFQPKANEFFNG